MFAARQMLRSEIIAVSFCARRAKETPCAAARLARGLPGQQASPASAPAGPAPTSARASAASRLGRATRRRDGEASKYYITPTKRPPLRSFSGAPSTTTAIRCPRGWSPYGRSWRSWNRPSLVPSPSRRWERTWRLDNNAGDVDEILPRAADDARQRRGCQGAADRLVSSVRLSDRARPCGDGRAPRHRDVIDWHARLTSSGCGSRQVDFVVTGTER